MAMLKQVHYVIRLGVTINDLGAWRKSIKKIWGALLQEKNLEGFPPGKK